MLGVEKYIHCIHYFSNMTKTNKSYTKRIRVTKRGKLVAKKPGLNHFNSKESAKNKMAKKRASKFNMSKKAQARFLPRGNR